MKSLRESMRMAAKDYGKSRLSQVMEIFRLALGPGQITAREYYDYCLFDDSRLSFLEKQQFLGHAGQEHIKKFLINDRWRILTDDKFVFDVMLRCRGFPLAKILATYNYLPNRPGYSVPSLNTRTELRSFLSTDGPYPCFGKPIAGQYGSGCVDANAFDRSTRHMTLANGETLTIDHFIENLGQYPDGYMFQERLHPHGVIGEVCGDRIAGVRIAVLIEPRGPQIHRAIWKIPTGKRMTDNFFGGRSGNLAASVNIGDGMVESVITGRGASRRSLEHHPDTGKRIQGLTLPYWPELKEICLEGAKIFPGFRLQSWDIAICEKGPVILEMQDGDYAILQASSRLGLLDDHLRQYLGSINRFWRQEIFLSMLDEIPRKAYRRCYPKQNGSMSASG